MKSRIFQFFLVLVVLISLVSCSGNQEKGNSGSSTTDVCDLATYKKHAIPVMEKFSGIINNLDIRDKDSRAATIEKIQAM